MAHEAVRTALVLEDNEAVKSLLNRYLRSKGYSVLQAGTGEQAIRISEWHRGPIHALIVDEGLPGGMTGTQATLWLVRNRPGIGVVFMSGTPMELWKREDDAAVIATLPPRCWAFLQKPFVLAALLAEVERILGAAGSAAVIWRVLAYVKAAGLGRIAPHDLRRTCARLCRAAGGAQMLFGHVYRHAQEFGGGELPPRVAQEAPKPHKCNGGITDDGAYCDQCQMGRDLRRIHEWDMRKAAHG